MFFRKKKEKPIISESKLDLSSYRIQTMPQQFLPEMMKPKSPEISKEDEFYASIENDHKGIDKTKLVGGIIICLAGIGIVLGVFYLYQSSFGKPSLQNVVPVPVGEKETSSSNIPEDFSLNKKELEKGEISEEQIIPTIDNNEQDEKSEEVAENIEPSKLPVAPDEDIDELSDVEESFYGTDVIKKDTDGDGYFDGEEIRNLYNPNGSGSLKDSGFITKFTDTGYEVWYPFSWMPEKNASGASTFFRASTGEMIQILLETKESSETLTAWYQKQNQLSSPTAGAFSEMKIGEFIGLSSSDGLTVYLTHLKDPKTVFVVFYNPVDQEILRYKTTFQMMLRSFSLL